MRELITSYIIQSKECKLGKVGAFRRSFMNAEADLPNKQINPVISEILFTGREEKISDDLVKYVADKMNITTEKSLSEIKDWCIETKTKLNSSEEIDLKPLGVLKKGQSGNVFFHTENKNIFFAPLNAERVIHKNSEHAMIVGDKETTSTRMSQFYHEEEKEIISRTWKIWSIILFVIALVILFIYFYGYPVSLSSFGNHIQIVSPSSPATYSIQ